MSERFFIPLVGDNYRGGIGRNKYRVLVLGASLYCDHDGKHKRKGKRIERCPHFNVCTSGDIKDSSAFNDRCPFSGDTKLEDDLKNESSSTMTRFADKMKERFGNLFDGDSIGIHIAFSEYVQYFLNHQMTSSDDLSDRDFDAFIETLDDLHPNVVIVWGGVVADTLRESRYAIKADDGEPWDFAWEYGGMFIWFICCTHPASGGHFYKDFPSFSKRFEDTINYEK